MESKKRDTSSDEVPGSACAERRKEKRYPCVGITLLYAPTEDVSKANLAELIFKAAVHDMSLSGLAFEVEREMQKGDKLVVLMRQPDCDAPARVMSEVRWCKKHSSGHFRVGVIIDKDEVVIPDSPGRHISDPIGKTTVPHALFTLCPACEDMVTFKYVGEQPVLAEFGIMPLYNCSGCGTTRSLIGIFYCQTDASESS